ncbi:hypothetical protein, partial [Kitasatospora sp. NPDC047058]|uniref:hypothetical protein n=1 Tax=Kitasatospora sp. NPDC047058 TaxID=3155620 RepID=UPI0033E9033C
VWRGPRPPLRIPRQRDGRGRLRQVALGRRRHEAPEGVRTFLGPGQAGYTDTFALATDGTASSPERWARALFEDVAGLQGQFIWRALLGLRLHRQASPQYVAGWRIAEHHDDRIRLEAHSWMLTGHLIVQVDDGQVSLTTVLRYRRPPAAWLWPPLAAVHRRLAPGLLRDAHRILQARPAEPEAPDN